MSKLAKKPIIIPEKVQLEYKDSKLSISGPLGKLSIEINPKINLVIDNKKIMVSSVDKESPSHNLEGLFWALIRNMVVGVTEGFSKKLEIRGVGYSAKVVGDKLILQLRFTHPIEYKIPEGIKISVDEKGIIITVFGIDKQKVGEVAAEIRRFYPPEPYKGTGIRYVGERVLKKVGKAVVGVGAGVGGAKK